MDSDEFVREQVLFEEQRQCPIFLIKETSPEPISNWMHPKLDVIYLYLDGFILNRFPCVLLLLCWNEVMDVADLCTHIISNLFHDHTPYDNTECNSLATQTMPIKIAMLKLGHSSTEPQAEISTRPEQTLTRDTYTCILYISMYGKKVYPLCDLVLWCCTATLR